MAFVPSAQQQAIFDWTSIGAGSAVIEAVAGSGKTTTLIKLLERTSGHVAFMAYNKKIADEIGAKVAPLGLSDRVKVGTVHSFGFSAIRKAFPRVKVDGNKLNLLATRLIEDEQFHPDLRGFALKTASMAKQVGIGALTAISDKLGWYEMVDHHALDEALPESKTLGLGDGLRAAGLLLKASNDETNVIDFDDMVYVPVQRGLKVWQHQWVLLDEAQDTNATRRALARMLLAPGGRLVAVGDPAQAIYGFTGADSNSLDLIRQDFRAITLPLTVSYRCPKAVVAEARQWVDHIQAAETAAEGEVDEAEEVAFWGTVANPGLYAGLGADDAVLCRNTKPLVTIAYGLLRRGKGCLIEGRDIGAGLAKLATKWKGAKTVKGLRSRLVTWRDAEVPKAVLRNQGTRAADVTDRVETLLEIMSAQADDAPVANVTVAISKLFGDTPPGQRPRVVTLSTIHKSKGREWRRVLWWGKSAYQPSKYARQEWQQGQERNLMYVAATRAQHTLLHVHADPEANLAA